MGWAFVSPPRNHQWPLPCLGLRARPAGLHRRPRGRDRLQVSEAVEVPGGIHRQHWLRALSRDRGIIVAALWIATTQDVLVVEVRQPPVDVIAAFLLLPQLTSCRRIMPAERAPRAELLLLARSSRESHPLFAERHEHPPKSAALPQLGAVFCPHTPVARRHRAVPPGSCVGHHTALWRRARRRAVPAERAARPRKCAAPAGGKPHRSVLRPAKVAQTLGTGSVQVPLPGGRLSSTACTAAAGPAHGTALSPLSRRQKHGGA